MSDTDAAFIENRRMNEATISAAYWEGRATPPSAFLRHVLEDCHLTAPDPYLVEHSFDANWYVRTR